MKLPVNPPILNVTAPIKYIIKVSDDIGYNHSLVKNIHNKLINQTDANMTGGSKKSFVTL